MGRKILIVEDNQDTSANLKVILENMGYTVTGIAERGEDVLQRTIENPPDLILMDIMLKGKMNGIEAAAAVRSHADIPVIYCTALADKNTIESVKPTEPFGFIIKPYNIPEIYKTLEIALYKHKLEKRLKETNSILYTVISNILEGIAALDEFGNIILMNLKAENVLGRSFLESAGKSFQEVFPLLSPEEKKPFPIHFKDFNDKKLLLLTSNKNSKEITGSLMSIKDEYGAIKMFIFTFNTK